MACSHPNPAVDYGIHPLTGTRKIKFLSHRLDMNIEKLKFKYGDKLMLLPCGKCPSCLAEKAKNWSVRCYLESLMHEDNCFITLTYDDEHLPEHLKKDHLTKFMKNLRDDLYKKGVHIKYFGCGEYGTNTKRPHYHALLFGFIPSDLRSIGLTPKGSQLYESQYLSSFWKKGFISVGLCTPESICYCARYTVKKSFEVSFLPKDKKEFLIMSRRPGLGQSWLMAHLQDLDSAEGKLYLGEFGIKSYSRYIMNLIKDVIPDTHDELIKARLEKCRIMMRDRMLSSGKSLDEVYWQDLEADLDKSKRNSRGL